MNLFPAYEGDKPYLFVSYAHLDSEKVIPIIEKLYNQKYRIWYDEGIAPGSEWPRNVASHLEASKGAIIFKSPNFYDSKNCLNEITRAKADPERLIIECDLDGFDTDLSTRIPKKFLGNGKGYDRKISRKKFGTLWNILLVVAFMLLLVLGYGLYGMNMGWFDAYLPGLKEVPVLKAALSDEKITETVDLGDVPEIFKKSIYAKVPGKQDLGNQVIFESNAQRDAFLDALGYTKDHSKVTYGDLTELKNKEIRLEQCSNLMFELLDYLPNIKYVYVRYQDLMTDIKIPEDAKYEIVMW